MLSLKWDYWTAFTTIFLKMCKLLSELINGTVDENHQKSGKMHEFLIHQGNGELNIDKTNIH